MSDDLGYPNIQAILDNTLRSVRRTIRARNDVKQRCLESLMYKRTARDLRRLKKKRNDNLRRRIREKLVKEAKKRQRIEKKVKAEMTNTPPPCGGAVPVEDGRGASAIVPSAPRYKAKGCNVPTKADLLVPTTSSVAATEKYKKYRCNALNYYRSLFDSDPLYNRDEGTPMIWKAFTDWFSAQGTPTASVDPLNGFRRVKGPQLLDTLNAMSDTPAEFRKWVVRGVDAMRKSGDIGVLCVPARAVPPLPPPLLPPDPAGGPSPEAATARALPPGEGPLALAEGTPANKKRKTGPDLDPWPPGAFAPGGGVPAPGVGAPKESAGPADVVTHKQALTGA